jgi:hypothetical protein
LEYKLWWYKWFTILQFVFGLPLSLEGSPKLVINDFQVKILANVGSRNLTADSAIGNMYLEKIKIRFEFDSIGVNLGQNNVFDPLFSALGQYYVRKVILQLLG